MLEMILAGMLAAIAIVMIAHTIEESIRPFEVHKPHRSSDPEFDDEPSWRIAVGAAQDDGARDDEREAA